MTPEGLMARLSSEARAKEAVAVSTVPMRYSDLQDNEPEQRRKPLADGVSRSLRRPRRRRHDDGASCSTGLNL